MTERLMVVRRPPSDSADHLRLDESQAGGLTALNLEAAITSLPYVIGGCVSARADLPASKVRKKTRFVAPAFSFSEAGRGASIGEFEGIL